MLYSSQTSRNPPFAWFVRRRVSVLPQLCAAAAGPGARFARYALLDITGVPLVEVGSSGRDCTRSRMSLIYEERSSESPYVDTIVRGQTTSSDATIRPAASSWHMAFVRHTSGVQPLIIGPWTKAGIASWEEGGEILWVRFKIGVFMPHQSPRDFLNQEMLLPNVSNTSFWLKDSAWQYPDYENVEMFISRLVREEVLVYDPVVRAALQGQLPDMSLRTVRHRFLRATGLTYSHIRQVERAQQAARLLHQGISISDTTYELGYFDQPHLTKALKQFIGQTPKQWVEFPPTETIQLGVPR